MTVKMEDREIRIEEDQLVRLGLRWADLFPTADGQIDADAVALYDQIIANFENTGADVSLVITSHDMPEWLEGASFDEQHEAFKTYVGACFDCFANSVRHWDLRDLFATPVAVAKVA